MMKLLDAAAVSFEKGCGGFREGADTQCVALLTNWTIPSEMHD
jgi:hypothetical protein